MIHPDVLSAAAFALAVLSATIAFAVLSERRAKRPVFLAGLRSPENQIATSVEYDPEMGDKILLQTEQSLSSDQKEILRGMWEKSFKGTHRKLIIVADGVRVVVLRAPRKDANK